MTPEEIQASRDRYVAEFPMPLHFHPWVEHDPLPVEAYGELPRSVRITADDSLDGTSPPPFILTYPKVPEDMEWVERPFFSISCLLDTTAEHFSTWLLYHARSLSLFAYPIYEGAESLLLLSPPRRDQSSEIPAVVLDGFAMSTVWTHEPEMPKWVRRARSLLRFTLLQISSERTDVVLEMAPNCLWWGVRSILLQACRCWPETGEDLWRVIQTKAALDAFQSNSDCPASSRVGATRLEEREDWSERIEKAMEFRRLLSKGVKQDRAAQLVGHSVNSLKAWNARYQQSQQSQS